MSTINFKDREIVCKIVYYGPSMSGKTTNICRIHESAPDGSKSTLQCVDTRGDRTLFFDHFALDVGQVGSMRVRFQIYGVPGQPHYRVTRKMVLSGVDGIVFVADSDPARLGDNLESLEDMRQLMAEHGYNQSATPTVIQYNKRDLPNAQSVGELEKVLNGRAHHRCFEAVAVEGKGVIDTFKAICNDVVANLNRGASPRDAAGNHVAALRGG